MEEGSPYFRLKKRLQLTDIGIRVPSTYATGGSMKAQCALQQFDVVRFLESVFDGVAEGGVCTRQRDLV